MTTKQTAFKQWIWIPKAVILAVQDEQLAEHGGMRGIRDEDLLDSALERPQQFANYGTPDFADLAASYVYGWARNHPFLDGNQRTAFVAALLFLMLNGYRLQASDADKVVIMLKVAVAVGEINEEAFAEWVRKAQLVNRE